MAVKKTYVDGIGEIKLYKRRGTRNLRLRINHQGEVSISLPMWAPYGSAIAFAKEKQSWILEQKRPPQLLTPNSQIGKNHRLLFQPATARDVKARVGPTTIVVNLPDAMSFDHPAAQKSATLASIRALKRQGNNLLPQRVRSIASSHGFQFKTVTIKQLKGRWGSCNQQGDIVLNCYLMQLPWHLIDYVILHELMHTKIMAHGAPFWVALDEHVSNLSEIRKVMRTKQPVLLPVDI